MHHNNNASTVYTNNSTTVYANTSALYHNYNDSTTLYKNTSATTVYNNTTVYYNNNNMFHNNNNTLLIEKLIPKPLLDLFSGSSVTTTGDAECSGRADGSYLQDEKHCRRYYECRSGHRVLHKCRAGQWFDLEEGKCRRRSLVLNCPAKRN
ncbi:Hypothetical predicted protein [Drosophila guanche]|uniref:Chitin-binding type-2 domain-containing protein n=1 Tax=Drosophila guanche TaxID=7266 RepID=A0A3B0JED1_DROGU|nr:Hypothetical predicted protein [Drosophila guanche]